MNQILITQGLHLFYLFNFPSFFSFLFFFFSKTWFLHILIQSYKLVKKVFTTLKRVLYVSSFKTILLYFLRSFRLFQAEVEKQWNNGKYNFCVWIISIAKQRAVLVLSGCRNVWTEFVCINFRPSCYEKLWIKRNENSLQDRTVDDDVKTNQLIDDDTYCLYSLK